MAGAPAVGLPKMQEFVRSLFRGNVDFSILTHAIVRKKYLECVGQKRLSKQEKEQLKHLVEEELVQMKVDDPPAHVELTPEIQDSFTPGDRKRNRCISDTSDEEPKTRQEQKKQRIAQKLEVSSEEEDSGIDSKKQKSPRKLSEFSDPGDSGAADHTAESGSDEPKTKNKGKEPSNAQRERQKVSKTAKRQWSRSSRDRLGSKEATDPEQSDLEEEFEGPRKSTKGNSLKKRDCKLWKQKKAKEFKYIDTPNKGKNKKLNEQSGGKDESDEENEPSTVEEICKMKRTGRVGHREAEGRTREKTPKASKGVVSEDGSGSDYDKASGLQKKMASSRCRRKSLSSEESGNSSDDSASQSQPRKERGKGRTRKESTENWSQKSGRSPKVRRTKKAHSGDASRKEKMAQKLQETRRSIREDSESEAGEGKGLKERKKWVQDAVSSDGESQSEETEECRAGKVTETSKTSDSKSDERQSGAEREEDILKKVVFGSDSSQEEEEPEKRGSQKSPRKNVSSALDSEDSGSDFGRKKKRRVQPRTTEKLKKRSKSREKEEDESGKEEAFSSGEGEVSLRQQHLGKDRKHSGKSEDHPSVQRLKRYIRECGVRRNYKKLLAGCRSRRAQIEVLRLELETLGLKGAPSLAKCKALKQKREEAAEMASLDISNIIATEGRPKRHNVWSLYNKPQGPPTSPEVCRRTTDWSRLRGVISSDEESS